MTPCFTVKLPLKYQDNQFLRIAINNALYYAFNRPIQVHYKYESRGGGIKWSIADKAKYARAKSVVRTELIRFRSSLG